MPELLTVDRMYDAIEASDDRAATFLHNYLESTNELLGRFYYDNDGVKRPLNLIARNIFTLQAHLSGRNPKHQLKTPYLQLRGEANIRALLLDETSEAVDRLDISRVQLLRAMLSPMAVTKVGIKAGADMVKVQGRLYDPGMPYILPIDMADHVCDAEARCRNELTWEGHRYRVPKGMALECGIFRPELIEDLPTVTEMVTTGEGRRPEFLSKRGGRGDAGREAVEMIELVDVVFYDDYQPLVATLPAVDGFADDYLRIQEYQGVSRGPYHWLEFCPIPNQLYGLPPVAMMREQSEAANALFGKMLDQVLRTKRLVIGPRSASDDLETAKDAQDGDVLEFDDPEAVKNLEFGGMAEDFGPFAQMLLAWSNMQYVNFDLAAGQEGGTDKATIYQGMQGNLNVIIDDLQNRSEKYETGISRELGWLLDTDPFMQKRMIRRIPGGEFIEVVYDAQTKKGTFQDFTTEIQYGSMLRQDPQVKAANLLQLIQIAMESIQITMATGGAWSTEGALRIAARYMGFDELDELVNDPMLQMQLQQQLMTAGQPGMGQPAGPSGVNPQAMYGARPAMGGAQPQQSPTPGRGARGGASSRQQQPQPRPFGSPRPQLAGV